MGRVRDYVSVLNRKKSKKRIDIFNEILNEGNFKGEEIIKKKLLVCLMFISWEIFEDVDKKNIKSFRELVELEISDKKEGEYNWDSKKCMNYINEYFDKDEISFEVREILKKLVEFVIYECEEIIDYKN